LQADPALPNPGAGVPLIDAEILFKEPEPPYSTDTQVLTNLAPVAKSLMEKAGFKADMQSMDWQTLVARRAKRDPPNAGGWHAFLTSWVSADISNPIFTGS